jgi:hypothetical protein
MVHGKEAAQGTSVLAATSIQFTKTAQQNAPAGQAGVA